MMIVAAMIMTLAIWVFRARCDDDDDGEDDGDDCDDDNAQLVLKPGV